MNIFRSYLRDIVQFDGLRINFLNKLFLPAVPYRIFESDHASMVRHGQVHGRFSLPLPSENEIDHVTMLILDTYMHEGEISLSSSIRTHVHGQHGHVNIWSIIALKSDHEGDHDLTMPDHVCPKFVEVNHRVTL